MVAEPPEVAGEGEETRREEGSTSSESGTGRGSGIGGAAGADAGRETGKGGRDTDATGEGFPELKGVEVSGDDGD